jgi:hypothetical protein
MKLINDYYLARLQILFSAIICAMLALWAGRLLDIPALTDQSASLMHQPNPAIAILAVGILVLIGTGIGTLFAGNVRFNAGLIAGCAGLATLSFRGGSIRQTLFTSLATNTESRLFLNLAVETAILALFVAIASWLLTRFHSLGRIVCRETGNTVGVEREKPENTWMAFAVQSAATAIFIIFLATTTNKQQVMAAVALGSFGGALVAQLAYPVKPSAPYVLPPLVVAIGGYLWLYFQSNLDIQTGLLYGSAHTLAHPLPIDYLAFGPSAAIVG